MILTSPAYDSRKPTLAIDLTAERVTSFLFDLDERQFIQALNQSGILDDAAARKLVNLIQSGQTSQSLMQVILNLGITAESELLNFFSANLGLRLLEAEAYPVERYCADSFNEKFLREQNVVVVSETDQYIEICINDPFSPELNDALSFAIGKRLLKIRLGFKKDINEALNLILRSDEEKQLSERFDAGDEILLERDIQQLKELASEAPVIKTVNAFIRAAVEASSSDIHIEPHADQLRIRNRIDGVLVTVQEIPMRIAAAVVSRVKILSSLDIAQRRVPQDGRFDINIDGQDIDIRVSVIPTIHGESIVLRLLYKKSISFNFDNLGYTVDNKTRILQMMNKPHGMILVTGPTGSGKSTTLYAMLQRINNSEKKIVAVEDPVEYKVEGVNQIQVNPDIGVNFSNALSAIVRHDPEVIMVGEMRDSETAEIAVRASMTGHLILSTLHTNNAASSIERLVDLGVGKSFVLSSLILVIAQRLVRRLCDHCKRPVEATHLFADSFDSIDPELEAQVIYEAVGCDHCNHSGYKGRISICEVMLVNDEFRAEAMHSDDNLQNLARKYGMQPMVIDGFDKVRLGQTTVEELFRVVLG
jgi:general secretion pathway protein E